MNEMERLRQEINNMIVSENFDEKELLEKSQELDKYIVQAMKESYPTLKESDSPHIKEFDNIINNISRIECMYDTIRIVDPVKKEVIRLKNNDLFLQDSTCYMYNNSGEICENCVSIRSLKEDDIITKIDVGHDRYYVIAAIPITYKGQKMAVEVFKIINNVLDGAGINEINGNRYSGINGNTSGEVNEFSNDKLKEYRNKILNSIEHMNRSIVKDKLTGLYNKIFVIERLPTEIARASLKDEPLSIVFIDPDNDYNYEKDFDKDYEDSQQIIYIAYILSKLIRDGNEDNRKWAARYSDNHLIVCLSNTDNNTAKSFVERVKRAIASKSYKEKISTVPVYEIHTVCNEGECLSFNDIIQLIENKLYKLDKLDKIDKVDMVDVK